MNALKAALVKLFLHFCALLPLSWARALGNRLVMTASAIRAFTQNGGTVDGSRKRLTQETVSRGTRAGHDATVR